MNKNFTTMSLNDIALEYLTYENPEITAEILIDDSVPSDSERSDERIPTLELVEWFAQENHLISSEDEASEQFDEQLNEWLKTLNYAEGCQYKDDEPFISSEFSNFMDSKQSDGQIHMEQVNNYDYVGEFS